MNRSKLLGTTVLAAFLALASGSANPVNAQASSSSTDSGQSILESALAAFRSPLRNKLTADRASQMAIDNPAQAWFKGFRGKTQETLANLQAVAEATDIAIPKGKRLSVAGKARPGDVIRVHWTQSGERKEATLVYVGREL